MFIRTFSVAVLLACLALSAGAAEPQPSLRPAAVGDSTRSLLELQISGRQAGPELPMLGAASVLSYQRYLESHKTAIPENFSSVLSRGSGSGGSGGGR